MRELSLFSGAGGGLLATHHLLGWRTIGYVEKDDYCQRVLAARIRDGLLDEAPIFGDIRAFNDTWAERYRGLVDVVTAGFPCAPFSQAGKRRGADDERNMWPATLDCIRLVRPVSVLLENVVGIKKYLPIVRDGLRQLGYCVAPPVYATAAQVGAGHIRRRVFILAHRERKFLRDESGRGSRESREDQEVAERSSRWSSEPGVARSVHGLAHRMDRHRALGNGQVPAMVERVWRLLATHSPTMSD